MLRLHIVPKPLSVHISNIVHGDNVLLCSAILSSAFRDIALAAGVERWPLADEKKVIRFP